MRIKEAAINSSMLQCYTNIIIFSIGGPKATNISGINAEFVATKMEQYKKQLIEFGKKVKQLRTEKGLSQRDLASLCTIDHADISRIENGEMNIKFSSIIQLADAFEVSPCALFSC